METVPHGLTPVQLSILQLSARGADQNEIARAMNYSPNTIKAYRNMALRKLGVTTTRQAVAIGYEEGWLKNENGRVTDEDVAA